MFALLFFTVHSKTTSKDMQRRGQWGGWQQRNKGWRRRDEKETEVRGGSGTLKCLLRGVVCCSCLTLLDECRTGLSVCLALNGGYILSRQPQSRPSHVAELQSPQALSWAATSTHQCKETIPIRFCFFISLLALQRRPQPRPCWLECNSDLRWMSVDSGEGTDAQRHIQAL